MSPSAQSAFSEKLRQRITALGLTQTEIASRTGIDRVDLNRMVNGKREPKPHEVAMLAVVLKTAPEELAAEVNQEEVRLFTMIAERVLEAEDRLTESLLELQAATNAHRAAENRWAAERQELIAETERVRHEAARRVAEVEAAAATREARLELRNREFAAMVAQRESDIAQLQATIAGNLQTITGLRREVAGANGRAIFTTIVGALAGAALAKATDGD